MGFEINGTEVLGTSGIVNNTNSFKTIGGTSIIGSGNITDDGASALLFNTIGSYSCASLSSSGHYQTSTAASNLKTFYRSQYGGFSYVTEHRNKTTYYSTTYHGLSGTWMHKSPFLQSANHYSAPDDIWYAAVVGSLWQRIA